MRRTSARSERIVQIEKLLLANRTPLSAAEIARRCSVHRSTIGRMEQSFLEAGIPLRIDDEGRWYIEKADYISTLKLRLHEATALFISARLLARYSNKPNSHTVEALEKLGIALQGMTPNLGHSIIATSAALRTKLPKQNSNYQHTLEKLTEAWARGTKLQIWYRPLHARRAYQHTFSPYLLEPSGIGYSVYVIGLAEPPGKLRTRKLDRIERIMSTDEPFDIPPDFDPNTLLAGAWSIWFDENDQPTPISLRFSGYEAIRRMKEDRWHPSERTEMDTEGRLIWHAEVDAPEEMLHWIRGWGSACEVLEPKELREHMIGELRHQMRVYGVNENHDRSEPDMDLLGAIFGE